MILLQGIFVVFTINKLRNNSLLIQLTQIAGSSYPLIKLILNNRVEKSFDAKWNK